MAVQQYILIKHVATSHKNFTKEECGWSEIDYNYLRNIIIICFWILSYLWVTCKIFTLQARWDWKDESKVHRSSALFQERRIELIPASLWIQPAVSLMLIHCWATRAWHENTKSGKSALEASRIAALSLLMQVTPLMGLRRWVHHGHRATKILPRREYRFREQWRRYLRAPCSKKLSTSML